MITIHFNSNKEETINADTSEIDKLITDNKFIKIKAEANEVLINTNNILYVDIIDP